MNKKLYDDNAALYYLLLHKWEKGQLQLPPTFTLRGHYSTNSLPPPSALPHINIQGIDSMTASTGVAVPQWQTLNAHLSKARAPNTCSSDGNVDDNLQRYLNLGRRHTFGAAHNVMIIPPEDMSRLRKINESVSSQTSSGFGSSGTNAQIHPEIPISVVPTLSTGLEEKGSINSSSRQLLHLPALHRSSRRRASDGGHYATAYRQFIEMRRNPGGNGGCTITSQADPLGPPPSNSVKHLLQDKIDKDKKYGRQATAQKQWILYKDQLNVNQYSSTGLGPNMTLPSALPPIFQLSNVPTTEPAAPVVDLRQQLQPFYEYSPQQIQEQLQHLHLQSSSTVVGGPDYSTYTAQPEQQPEEALYTNNNSTHLSNDTNSSSSINTQKSSTSSSLIAQLLSPPTPPMPSINLPTMGTKTPSASTAEYVDSLATASLTSPRRYSAVQPPVSTPSLSPQVRQKRKTLPVLSPTPIPDPNEDIGINFSANTYTEPEDITDSLNGSANSYQFNSYRSTTNNGQPISSSPVRAGCTSPSSYLSAGSPQTRSISPPLPVPAPTIQPHQITDQQLASIVLGDLHVPLRPESSVSTSGPPQLVTTALTPGTNGLIYENQSIQAAHLQQIPIYLNQHISLIHPKIASQIAQEQVHKLVVLISNVLNKSGIVYEYNGNIFTVSHQGVEFQIHVQVSSHYTMQNALQMNLQYMHISGDPHLYRTLCTQLAPNFIPTTFQ